MISKSGSFWDRAGISQWQSQAKEGGKTHRG